MEAKRIQKENERVRLEREEACKLAAEEEKARLEAERVKQERTLEEQGRQETKAPVEAERIEQKRLLEDMPHAQVLALALSRRSFSISDLSCSSLLPKGGDICSPEEVDTILVKVARSMSEGNVTSKTEPVLRRITSSILEDNGTSGVTRVVPGSPPAMQTATTDDAVSTSDCDVLAFKTKPVDNSNRPRPVSLDSGASNVAVAAIGGSVYSSMSRIE